MRGTQLAVMAQLLGFAAGKSLSNQGVYLRATLCGNTRVAPFVSNYDIQMGISM